MEEIGCLFGGLRPILCRCSKEMCLQLLVPKAQRSLVILHLSQHAPNFGGLLGRHSAMLVKVDCFVCHVIFSWAPGWM
jgi:hypothetical protein